MTPPAPSSGLQKGWVSAQQKESGKLGGSGGGGGFGNPTAFQQQQQNIVWGAGNRTEWASGSSTQWGTAIPSATQPLPTVPEDATDTKVMASDPTSNPLKSSDIKKQTSELQQGKSRKCSTDENKGVTMQEQVMKKPDNPSQSAGRTINNSSNNTGFSLTPPPSPLSPPRRIMRPPELTKALIAEPVADVAGFPSKWAGYMVGECESMCPEEESTRREELSQLDYFERIALESSSKKDLHLVCIKKFARGVENKPSLLRTPAAMWKTLQYLFDLAENSDYSFKKTYQFVADRFRSIHQDVEAQSLDNGAQFAEILEHIIRYAINAQHELCEQRASVQDPEGFNAHLNIEQLNKALTSVSDLYANLRLRSIVMPAEAEMKSYQILLQVTRFGSYQPTDLELHRVLAALPKSLLSHPEISLACKALQAARCGNFLEFFRLCNTKASYLQACLMELSFPELRLQAVGSLCQSMKGSTLAVSHLTKLLFFDSPQQTVEFFNSIGMERTIETTEMISGDELSQMLRDRTDTHTPVIKSRAIDSKRPPGARSELSSPPGQGSALYYTTLSSSFSRPLPPSSSGPSSEFRRGKLDEKREKITTGSNNLPSSAPVADQGLVFAPKDFKRPVSESTRSPLLGSDADEEIKLKHEEEQERQRQLEERRVEKEREEKMKRAERERKEMERRKQEEEMLRLRQQEEEEKRAKMEMMMEIARKEAKERERRAKKARRRALKCRKAILQFSFLKWGRRVWEAKGIQAILRYSFKRWDRYVGKARLEKAKRARTIEALKSCRLGGRAAKALQSRTENLPKQVSEFGTVHLRRGCQCLKQSDNGDDGLENGQEEEDNDKPEVLSLNLLHSLPTNPIDHIERHLQTTKLQDGGSDAENLFKVVFLSGGKFDDTYIKSCLRIFLQGIDVHNGDDVDMTEEAAFRTWRSCLPLRLVRTRLIYIAIEVFDTCEKVVADATRGATAVLFHLPTPCDMDTRSTINSYIKVHRALPEDKRPVMIFTGIATKEVIQSEAAAVAAAALPIRQSKGENEKSHFSQPWICASLANSFDSLKEAFWDAARLGPRSPSLAELSIQPLIELAWKQLFLAQMDASTRGEGEDEEDQQEIASRVLISLQRAIEKISVTIAEIAHTQSLYWPPRELDCLVAKDENSARSLELRKAAEINRKILQDAVPALKGRHKTILSNRAVGPIAMTTLPGGRRRRASDSHHKLSQDPFSSVVVGSLDFCWKTIASLRASLVPLLVDDIVIGYLMDWFRRTHEACDDVFLPYYQQRPREAPSDRKRRSSTGASTSPSDPHSFSKKKKKKRGKLADETVESKPLSSSQPPVVVVQRRAHSNLISSIQAEHQKWRELDASLKSIDHGWPSWVHDDDGSSKSTSGSYSRQTVDSGSNDIDEILRAELEAEAEVLRMLVSNKQKGV